MPLEIPDLTGTSISKLSVACYVKHPGAELIAWVEKAGERQAASVHKEWLISDYYFNFEADGPDLGEMSCGILTLELATDSFLPPDQQVEAIQDRFSHFYSRHAAVRLFSAYRIPLYRLPRDGRISALIGVTTDIGKVRLEYTGAKTRVHGSIFNKFNWELVPADTPDGDPSIEAIADAWMWSYGELTEEILTEAVPLVMSAFDCFVLDKPCDDSICLNEETGDNT